MSGHPNRRTVVRTAVWTVPAVAVVTAAPALAVSAPGVKPILSFDTFNFFRAEDDKAGNPTKIETKVQVQNRQQTNGPTLTSLMVTVSFPDNRTNGGAPTIVSGPGWSFASADHTGGNWVYTFKWVGSIATSKSTQELDFRVPLTLVNNDKFTINGLASSGGGVGVGTFTGKIK